MRRILIVGTIGIAASMFTASCGGGSDQAKLRVINASPDEGSMDVLVDTKTISSGLAFGTATGYAALSSGSRHLQIEPSGTTTPVVDETLSLGSGSDTTVLLANFAATLNAVTLLDNNAAPASGTANVRIVNAAAALGPADVYLAPDGTDINTVAPVLSGLAFEGASGYSSVNAGTYRVWFTAPGQKFVFIDSGPITLNAGQVKTVVGMSTTDGSYSSAVLPDLN